MHESCRQKTAETVEASEARCEGKSAICSLLLRVRKQIKPALFIGLKTSLLSPQTLQSAGNGL